MLLQKAIFLQRELVNLVTDLLVLKEDFRMGHGVEAGVSGGFGGGGIATGRST